MCHNALGDVIITRRGNRRDEGPEEGRKRPRDTLVSAAAVLITVFRDNYPPARGRVCARAIYPVRAALCRSSSLVDRFSLRFSRAREPQLAYDALVSARRFTQKRERGGCAGTRHRVCSRFRVGGTGCVHPGDGCKQSRRCSLCNANA